MMQSAYLDNSVTTVILAGGQGSRIGGNKALQILRERPLVDWVFDAVRPQSTELLISANEHQAAYAHLGCPVIADRLPGHAGPLAGLQAAMQQASCTWIVSVPCDTPFLPADLIVKLRTAAQNNTGVATVAAVQGKRQPTIALYHKDVLARLNAYLAQGGRKVGGWLDTLQPSEVTFDDASAFMNLNTQEELRAL